MSEFGRTLMQSRPREGGLLVYALGQAGFALRGAGRLVLIDPWLSTALEEAEGVFRPAAPPLRPDEVEAVDLVCITHEHADHFDPRTVAAVAAQVPGARFVVPAPAVGLVAEAGAPVERITGIRAGETIEAGGARVTAVAAAHKPDPTGVGHYGFWLDEHGDHRALGYLVELEGHRVFHAGDTVWWHGLEGEIRALAPELAILPINGRDPLRESRAIWGNLNGEEAAGLAAAAGVPAVLACHFDGVHGNLGDPETFLRALAFHAPGVRGHVLQPGEQLEL